LRELKIDRDIEKEKIRDRKKTEIERNVKRQRPSKHFIFFATCEWVHGARVLGYTLLKRLACRKHSSLMGPFVNCKK
jgi:hypothetical protein